MKRNWKWRSPTRLGILLCIMIMTATVVILLSTSLPTIAPYALFLLCPLIHLVMHGAMHNHHGHNSERSPNRR